MKSRLSKSALNPWQSVCIGLYLGGQALSHATYGANRGVDALRHLARLRAQGLVAHAAWTNIGAWNRDLWVQDLARPFGVQPEVFYDTCLCDERGLRAA